MDVQLSSLKLISPGKNENTLSATRDRFLASNDRTKQRESKKEKEALEGLQNAKSNYEEL